MSVSINFEEWRYLALFIAKNNNTTIAITENSFTLVGIYRDKSI